MSYPSLHEQLSRHPEGGVLHVGALATDAAQIGVPLSNIIEERRQAMILAIAGGDEALREKAMGLKHVIGFKLHKDTKILP